MAHTRIPEDELKVFNSLTDIKVVFDVGSRDDVDYLIHKPGIELHAFEPNQEFFEQLKTNVKDTPNVYINNFGCGDIEGEFQYNHGGQSISLPLDVDTLEDKTIVTVKRLDKYIEEHGIEHIDFLKIDTEGYEPNVMRGLGNKVKTCRYIQYERDNGGKDIGVEQILKDNGFTSYYTGYRNQIAVREGELMPWIPEETQEGGVPEKDESNYLK